MIIYYLLTNIKLSGIINLMNSQNTIKIPTNPDVIREVIRQYHSTNGKRAGQTNLKKGREYFVEINKLATVARWKGHTKPSPEEYRLLLKRNKMNSDSLKFGNGSIIEVEDLKQIMQESNNQCSRCPNTDQL